MSVISIRILVYMVIFTSIIFPTSFTTVIYFVSIVITSII